MTGGVIVESVDDPHFVAHSLVRAEQLRLFEPESEPEFNEWMKMPLEQGDDKGRMFRWHQPVTQEDVDQRHLYPLDELWIVYAMPSGTACHEGCRRDGRRHYHCDNCKGRIEYGSLHGAGGAWYSHYCLNCLAPRAWGRQEKPEYD